MTKPKNKCKFHIGHFPIGTTFMIKEDIQKHFSEEYRTGPLTVKKLLRNGPKSYIIELGINDLNIAAVIPAVNIDHVTQIVKRGTGPVKVDGIFPIISDYIHSCDQSAMLENRKIFRDIPDVRKNSYVFHTCYSAIIYFINSVFKNTFDPTSVISLHLIENLLKHQTFIKRHSRFGPVIVNKKRMLNFLKSNKNRFLASVKETKKEYEKLEFEERSY